MHKQIYLELSSRAFTNLLYEYKSFHPFMNSVRTFIGSTETLIGKKTQLIRKPISKPFFLKQSITGLLLLLLVLSQLVQYKDMSFHTLIFLTYFSKFVYMNIMRAGLAGFRQTLFLFILI